MPHIRQIILGPRILHFLSCRIEDEVDFRNLKASDFDLEPHGDEALQLDLEDFLVPARLLGQTIVGDQGQDISLTSMATAAGLERRTFLRRFANATGMAPIEYCRAVRIARARELLEFGNTPQKEIAQSLGYKDVAAFARVFRKATGLPPGAYRKSFGLNAALRDDSAQKDSSRPKLQIFEAAVRPADADVRHR